MSAKANCYRLLATCEADPLYSNTSVATDICGHAVNLMGLYEWPTFAVIRDWLGFDHPQGDELWWMCHDGNQKDATLTKFARLILRVHGPGPEGAPNRLRLL